MKRSLAGAAVAVCALSLSLLAAAPPRTTSRRPSTHRLWRSWTRWCGRSRCG